VSLSPEQQVRYIGKTGIPTQNVLAVCDFDMCFTYVATGQPGAMHDTSVLYNAISVDKEFSLILHEVTQWYMLSVSSSYSCGTVIHK
jgi:hypothetical protein